MDVKKEPEKIVDISLSLTPGMVTYPNNPELSIEPAEGESSFLSRVSLGSHTGTHVDAPRHVFSGGAGVDMLPLNSMAGPCRVLDFTSEEKSITKGDLEDFGIRTGERLLVKTKNSLRGFQEFFDDYVFLDGDAAEFLAAQHIGLFGIDYLSVKQRGSEDNRAHTELLQKGVVIFEGLDLSEVEAGEYFFVGLPLKLVRLDGAPARAILLR